MGYYCSYHPAVQAREVCGRCKRLICKQDQHQYQVRGTLIKTVLCTLCYYEQEYEHLDALIRRGPPQIPRESLMGFIIPVVIVLAGLATVVIGLTVLQGEEVLIFVIAAGAFLVVIGAFIARSLYSIIYLQRDNYRAAPQQMSDLQQWDKELRTELKALDTETTILSIDVQCSNCGKTITLAEKNCPHCETNTAVKYSEVIRRVQAG